MEKKATELLKKIQETCVKFHYFLIDTVLQDAQSNMKEIQEFCSSILQENIFGMEEEDYQLLQAYTIQVLEDFIGAMQHQDMVWMLDTLDAGLRELLLIFIDENEAGVFAYE